MRKIVLTLMIVAFLACPAMAQRYRQMQLTIVDEFGDPVTNIDEIEIYDAGTSDTSTIYPRRDGGTMTNPITTDSTASTFSQSLGQVTWFQAAASYKVTITEDGASQSLTIDNITSSDTRFPWYVNYIGEAATLQVTDDTTLDLGTSDDFYVDWDNANSKLIIASAADGGRWDIGLAAVHTDIYWHTGAAITSDYVLFDEGSHVVDFIDVDLMIDDEAILYFGSGDDVSFDYDHSNNDLDVLSAGDLDLISWGATGAGYDQEWWGEAAGDNVLFDVSENEFYFTDIDIMLDDDGDLIFGDGEDFVIDSDTDKTLDFTPAAASDDYIVNLGLDQSGVDLKLFGTTTGAYMLWDASANALWLDKSDIAFSETDGLLFGDALGTGDFRLDATSAVLTLAQVSVDTGTVVIGVDDHDIPITWHGEATGADIILTGDTILFDGIDMTFEDADVLKFGDAGADGTIQSDGTNIDVDINAALTLGDGGTSHYANIAPDGEITLVGTAKVTKNHQLPISVGGGTATVSALTGAPSIDFNADGEIAYVSFQVPNDWDAASDMTIVAMIKNEIAETDGDDIEIICTVKGIADGEAHTDAGQTVTMALDMTGGDEGQNYVNKITGTIDYNEASHPIAAGDTVIIKAVISLGAGTEPTGPQHIIDWWIEYTADKLGTAT